MTAPEPTAEMREESLNLAQKMNCASLDVLVDALAAARAAEREQCAKIAEKLGWETKAAATGAAIARAIREAGE